MRKWEFISDVTFRDVKGGGIINMFSTRVIGVFGGGPVLEG